MTHCCRLLCLLIFFIFNSANAEVVHIQPPAEQRQALIDLYNSTNGDNWINNSNWLSDDVCTWYGRCKI